MRIEALSKDGGLIVVDKLDDIYKIAKAGIDSYIGDNYIIEDELGYTFLTFKSAEGKDIVKFAIMEDDDFGEEKGGAEGFEELGDVEPVIKPQPNQSRLTARDVLTPEEFERFEKIQQSKNVIQ
jgi:hypothetical protein